MKNPIGNILRVGTRQKNDPLNVICAETHERTESNIARCNVNFYAFGIEGLKHWNKYQTKVPNNYHILNRTKKENQLPNHVDYDLVLSQSIQQFQILNQISKVQHLPIIYLEHTLPYHEWNADFVKQIREVTDKADLKLFISEYSREKWGYDENTAEVVHHGVDTELFTANDNIERSSHLLSVVNDWKNRGWCCGYDEWTRISKGLPVRVVGDTEGLSKPANGVDELVKEYQSAEIFLNTSLISPVPTSLLEAMSAGCAIVTTSTCMLPEIIKNGQNGFISNDEKKLREYCQLLLNDKELCRKMGAAARQTILDSFSLDKFVQRWTEIFSKTANIPFLG